MSEKLWIYFVVECFTQAGGGSDAPGNSAPLDPLFSIVGTLLFLRFYIQPLYFCLLSILSQLCANSACNIMSCLSPPPRRCREPRILSVVPYQFFSQWNAHRYFMNTFKLASQKILCILDRPILFCVFDVFQEMVSPIEWNGVDFSDFWEK